MQNDTIAAIATPQGVGGVGVIRVSGGESFQLVAPLLRRPGKESIPSIPPTHHLTYRVITDPQTQEVLDEVLVAFMRAPHTYTCEDVVEIQGHGGPLILRRILRAVLRQGARLANPGEFTLRSFLNGRLDLAQAEAVMDLIGSQTEAGQRLAMQQLRGKLSEQVQQARTSMLGAIARIEASIDFPEDDVPTPLAEELQPFIIEARQQVDKLLAGSDQGRLYRQGVRTAIIGRPNVGKSSLLNALLRMERAIVTPIAGTTRDTVEEIANLRGVPLHLIDTAGMTPTEDPVERIGVERSRAAAENADIILHVFDGSVPLAEHDWQVLEELRGMGYGKQGARPVIAVLNKSDCEQVITPATLAELWPGAPVVATSTLVETGLEELENTLAELVQAGSVMSNESVLITSARHQEALRRGEGILRPR
ncbi:tRNA modification GTPase MnmE [Ktedonospora formicarum]|uniref:tRNA modification GTPase MnmE n=1 Tax=Ktedonospora formicarum TaxID=2778364 RepID=A0A8J3HTM0_9CHLR|nr:tRNA uridine-5-carboxymethylaminomethyl(34) synthesis GTPase MnmE [Ktedonospora formicarum]GHO43757.1 tRNA modification GTPase MnmE [Ktedonospora formicarum]